VWKSAALALRAKSGEHNLVTISRALETFSVSYANGSNEAGEKLPSSPNTDGPTWLHPFKQIPNFIQEPSTFSLGAELSYAFEVVGEAIGICDYLFFFFRFAFGLFCG
jgi:hypothetical protein